MPSKLWTRAATRYISRVAALVAVLSCTEPMGTPSTPNVQAEGTQRLARWMAASMGSQALRAELFSAMQASPITQHKLILSAFASTDAGRALIGDIARANHRSVAEVDAIFRGVPSQELIMIYPQHRSSWTPDNAGVEVAAVSAVHSTSVVAFSVAGGSRSVTFGSIELQHPLLIIRPVRNWSRRVGVNASYAGNVIQDANENEISGTLTTISAAGERVEVPLADLPRVLPPAEALGRLPDDAPESIRRLAAASSAIGTAAAAVVTVDTTWLISVRTSISPSDYDGSYDPYFNACYRLYSGQGFCTENRIVHLYGTDYNPPKTLYPVLPLVFHSLTDSANDNLSVTARQIDRGTGETFYIQQWDITWRDRIWTDPVNGTYFYADFGGTCVHCLWMGLFSWRKQRTPPPPPPPLAVTIGGPSSIRSGSVCTWTTSGSGGAGQYSYTWKKGTSVVGSGNTYQTSSSAAFTLTVVATDASNATATASKSVTISASAPLCVQ